VTTSGNSDDRDELDDPALRSMRAVWISMRDEEPPATGLVELLAAARAKAEEMRPREPWWQRALAALRRPPVLALATVMVLLGGAIVIGTQRESFQAMPTGEADRAKLDEPAVQSRSAAPAKDTAAGAPGAGAAAAVTPEPAGPAGAGAAAPVGAGPAGAGAAAPVGAAGAEAKPQDEKRSPERPKLARPETASRNLVPPAPPPPPPPSAALEVEEGAAPSAAKQDPVESGDKRAPMTPSAPAPAPAMAPKGKRAPVKPDLQIADDADGAGKAPAAADVAGSPSAGGSRGEGRPRGPSVTQLAKQSETAASRGDCAAVRAIVSQIRRLDPAFEKAHVERNAAVKRCVK